jgi:2Fe-2S ferredoxin
MVKIVIENLGQKEIVANDPTSAETTARKADKPLLRLIQEAGIDWMTDCGGKGRCTTCRAIIVKGGENLTPLSPAELKYRQMQALRQDERLMCQARLREALPRSEARTRGDLILRVPNDTMLPHMKYSE